MKELRLIQMKNMKKSLKPNQKENKSKKVINKLDSSYPKTAVPQPTANNAPQPAEELNVLLIWMNYLKNSKKRLKKKMIQRK